MSYEDKQNMVPGDWYPEHSGREGDLWVMKDHNGDKKYKIVWPDATEQYLFLSQPMGEARKRAFAKADGKEYTP